MGLMADAGEKWWHTEEGQAEVPARPHHHSSYVCLLLGGQRCSSLSHFPSLSLPVKVDLMVVLAPQLLLDSIPSSVQIKFDYGCLFAQKIDEERVATWKTNSERNGTLCSAS
jgi:hypothetical protein